MKKHTGFTLIELMVSLAILAAIISVATPSFKSMLENHNVPAIAKTFEKSIKLARTEAINRNTTVDVRSTSGTTDWSQGWYIEFTDDKDNVHLIRRFEALQGNPTFTSTVFDDATRLQILSSGQAYSLAGGGVSFNLFYADNCAAGSFSFTLLNSGIVKKQDRECD